MTFVLHLLGGTALSGPDGPLSGPPVQRHRIALLALLALAHPRTVSRDKLMGVLWPERDTERARNLLNQATHALRRALGAGAIRTVGDDLQLDVSQVSCDVVRFNDALATGDYERAVQQYAGPLLEGFFLEDSPEFDRWCERERDLLGTRYAAALETLATRATADGDSVGALRWWRERAAHDVYDTNIALQVMWALERSGNRAGALQYAQVHEELLRKDLDLKPQPELDAAVERLRRAPLATSSTLDVIVARTASAPAQSVVADTYPLDSPPVAPARSPRPWRARVLVVAGIIALLVATGPVLEKISARTNRLAANAVDAARGTTSIAAYELSVRGNDPALLRSDSAARLGVEYYRQAIALDSNFAAAWVGLARLQVRVFANSLDPARSRALAEAEASVLRAIALDRQLADAHAVLGLLRGVAFDASAAERHLLHAIDLAPARAQFREWLATFYISAERPLEALAQAERARSLDPLSPSATAEVARALVANDRCTDAMALLRTLERVQPPLLRVAPMLAQCHARQGRWFDAVAVLQPQAARNDFHALALLGYMHARAGQRIAAESIHVKLMQQRRAARLGAFYLSFVPAAMGDRDAAFAWLDSAFVEGSLGYFPGRRPSIGDPPFDVLRDDARLFALRRRLGIVQSERRPPPPGT